MGCDRGCGLGAVEQVALAALADAGLTPADVGTIASIDLKSDESALCDLAALWAVKMRFYSAARLEAETPRLANPSETVFSLTGCHGVAEAAALASVGEKGRLLVGKIKGEGATAAVAGWL